MHTLVRSGYVVVSVLLLAACGDRDRRAGGGPGPGPGGIASCGDGCARVESVCMLSDPECAGRCGSSTSSDQATFFGCAGMETCSAILDCLCAADPECSGGGGCACDVDFECSAGCVCDPECTGGGGDAGGSGGGDSGGEGASCTCSADPGAGDGVGTRCAGSADGCAGFGLSGELACLAESRSGSGSCRYPCTDHADCPSGFSCADSVLRDAAGSFWRVCVR